MISNEEMLKIYEEKGALLTGHFLLSSGRHSDRYLQSALVLSYPDIAERLGKELAQFYKDDDIDVVLGPAMGGIVVAYEVARALGKRALFTERENGKMTLRRGFSINKGDKVLICEDVVTTGGSVKEVISYLKEIGAEIVGVAYIVDRSNGKVDFGYKQHSLLSLEVQSYDKDECPLCKKGVPVVKPGSRNLK